MSSRKPSKPSKTNFTESSEDISHDLHFDNVFQSTLAENTQSMSNDAPASGSGWVEGEGADDMFGFHQDFDNGCQSDYGLHASYLREFVLDIEQTERTVGEPQSLERSEQAHRPWEAHIGGLHETLARVDQNSGVLGEFPFLISQRTTGYLVVLLPWRALMLCVLENRNIWLRYRPQDATNDWQHDFLQRRKAFQAAYRDYKQRQQE